jgi:hypothetical protein
MNAKKLRKLRREMESLRRSPQPARSLEQLATQLGRKIVKRGKHPMWMSEHFQLRPLSIPHHTGDLPNPTRNSILDQLEDDVFCWEEMVGETGDGE